MPVLDQWAARWGVSPLALADLRQALGMYPEPPAATLAGKSEAHVQSLARVQASRDGGRLWRNNVGALLDDRGVPVRYGLANDSAALNAEIKSADLIGITPVLITPAHVGCTIGQFTSRECKRPGWRYTGTERERAQLKWALIVLALGGDARFTTGQ
jgi:hypothetical protein